MRGRLPLVAVTLAVTLAGTARAQDFDPHGRHRGPPPRPPATAPRPAPAPGGAPAPTTPAAPSGPSQAALLDRYTRVVLDKPGDAFPLQRIAQIYRERDGNIAKLIADFEQRAAQAGPEQYAATVALAGLYKLDGRGDDAVAAFEKATALNPGDPAARLALAHLYQDRSDLPRARAEYEAALGAVKAKADREQTLRTLVGLELDLKDWDAAKKTHQQLVTMEPGSLFVKAELGHELYARGEFARAEVELRDVVAAAAGDNRALAPALKDLGQAQAKAHENEAALATLKRALAASGEQSALRAEVYAIITEIYRADQRLPELVKQIEDEHPGDFPRLALLGGLYEETGDATRAIATYKRALAFSPRQIDLRLRMIRLLESSGDLDGAIAEYAGLIRAAPDNPQFVFEECEALLQRGDRARAMKLVTDLEARAGADEEILSRVADFYAKVGDAARSLAVLQRLAQSSSGDAGHLVDLGDRYYQDGNVPRAVETWKRILAAVQPRAKALTALGDVYLEHDMTQDALAAYKEAVALDPASLGTKRSLAAAYERAHGYKEARALYEEIIARARDKGDKTLARECRSRIVSLWGMEHVLEAQLPTLKKSFAATPPDLEAGRMLAEAELHLRRLGDAEVALRKILELAPGDVESYLALERVLTQESKIAEAIDVLARLAEVEPKRARELYERMAQYALQIYKDDDAIRYAARAVALNPDDAEGHRRLGEMYRSKQDVEHAIAEFRAAITKNDRLYVVYFELADLLLSKGLNDDADRLFRRVVRGAPDDELVARAARLSTQINLGRGSLESLEQELLPLAIGEPQRPIYRHLLVEIYGSLTFGLVQRVTHGAAADAADARAALARIGARAVKPLLDALADADVTQQRIAIDVLAYVQNRNAAVPLFAYATGSAEASLRTRAMIACGALADPALVPRVDALLFPKGAGSDTAGPTDAIGVAAVWGLARTSDPRALPVLRRVARSGAPAMRALAVLGLAAQRDRASIGDVATLARSADSGNVARAAAAYALGALDGQAQVPALLDIAEGTDEAPRRMAMLALASMAASAPRDPAWLPEAAQALADSVFAADDAGRSRSVADTAVTALAMIARRGPPRARGANDLLPVPDGPLDADATLDGLVPRDITAADRAAALVRFSEPLERAALAALRTSGARSRAVLDALGTGSGELLPFVPAGAPPGAAASAARAIGAALVPSLVPLAKHPDPAVRERAVVLLASAAPEKSDATSDAVLGALEDSSEAVQRVALGAVGRPATPKAVAAVGKVLATNESWPMRVLAAQAMGRLGRAGAGADAGARLGEATRVDTYALVRQAALEALATFDAAGAKTLAARLSQSDPEPRVREAAAAIAAGAASPRE